MLFNGSLENRRVIGRLPHLEGHWGDGGGVHGFRCVSDEPIQFGSPSGQLQVKGHPAASGALEQRLQQAVASSTQANGPA